MTEWSWVLFKAYWSGFGYIVYLKDTGGKVDAALAFDTGAACTVLSVAALTDELVDKEALSRKLDQRAKRRRFRSASGTDMHGYLVCADNMTLAGHPVGKFYYYLIVDVDDVVDLLGDDLLSYCDFQHKKRSDIEVSDFDEQLYQAAYSGAIGGNYLQTLLEELTITDV